MEKLHGKDLLDKLKALAEFAKEGGSVPSDYCRSTLKNTTITDSPMRQWTYQFCTAFGWFQTNSNIPTPILDSS